MTDRDADLESDALFEQFLSRRAPDLRLAAEEDADRPFLEALFVACSPLRGALPDPIMRHQAVIRETGYRADFPSAMRRILVEQDVPIGRVMIDWSDDAWLIDIAVLPDRQRSGTGTAVLLAYLDVVDRRGHRAGLQVMRDNPALRLYERLGFAAVEARDFAPYIDMIREPRDAG